MTIENIIFIFHCIELYRIFKLSIVLYERGVLLSEFEFLFSREYKKNYGTNSDHSITTLVYCVHGKNSKTCCEKVDMNDIDSEFIIFTWNYRRNIIVWQKFTEHCHKPRTEGQDHKARRKLLIASGLCVVFIIVEVIGKYKVVTLCVVFVRSLN